MRTKTNKDYNNCPDCGKPISFYAKHCSKCSWKLRNKTKIKKKCKDCGIEISWQSTRCKKCNNLKLSKDRQGSKNPNYKTGKTAEKRKRAELYGKGNTLIEHHLYGKKFKKTMILNRSIHNKLHARAYWYILERFGKKGINEYIGCFLKLINA